MRGRERAAERERQRESGRESDARVRSPESVQVGALQPPNGATRHQRTERVVPPRLRGRIVRAQAARSRQRHRQPDVHRSASLAAKVPCLLQRLLPPPLAWPDETGAVQRRVSGAKCSPPARCRPARSGARGARHEKKKTRRLTGLKGESGRARVPPGAPTSCRAHPSHIATKSPPPRAAKRRGAQPPASAQGRGREARPNRTEPASALSSPTPRPAADVHLPRRSDPLLSSLWHPQQHAGAGRGGGEGAASPHALQKRTHDPKSAPASCPSRRARMRRLARCGPKCGADLGRPAPELPR